MDDKEVVEEILGRTGMLTTLYGLDSARTKAARDLFVMEEFHTERAETLRKYYLENMSEYFRKKNDNS